MRKASDPTLNLRYIKFSLNLSGDLFKWLERGQPEKGWCGVDQIQTQRMVRMFIFSIVGLEIKKIYVDSFFISNFDQIYIHRVSFGKSKWGGSIELEQGIKYENECGLAETTSSIFFDHYNSSGMKISKIFFGV